MKMRVMALLCGAAVTISSPAMLQESEVARVVDESTQSGQQFRAFLSNGEVYSVQHTQGIYNCQHIIPKKRGPATVGCLVDKDSDESQILFLAIQSIYTQRQQAKISE